MWHLHMSGDMLCFAYSGTVYVEHRIFHVVGVEWGRHVCGTVYLQGGLQNGDTVVVARVWRTDLP